MKFGVLLIGDYVATRALTTKFWPSDAPSLSTWCPNYHPAFFWLAPGFWVWNDSDPKSMLCSTNLTAEGGSLAIRALAICQSSKWFISHQLSSLFWSLQVIWPVISETWTDSELGRHQAYSHCRNIRRNPWWPKVHHRDRQYLQSCQVGCKQCVWTIFLPLSA